MYAHWCNVICEQHVAHIKSGDCMRSQVKCRRRCVCRRGCDPKAPYALAKWRSPPAFMTKACYSIYTQKKVAEHLVVYRYPMLSIFYENIRAILFFKHTVKENILYSIMVSIIHFLSGQDMYRC